MRQLSARQVHLDFHTSEHIPDVGARFSRTEFQAALREGRLGSITVFSKCHHGWSYYPTKVGSPHPNLRIDLLGEQLAACHEIGVRAPIYYTVGWSAADAELHPDWCVRTAEGQVANRHWDFAAAPTDPRPGVSWKFLCPGGGYRKLILEQIREICGLYPVDGMFFDITNGPACFCDHCRTGMAAEGIPLDDPRTVEAYNKRKWKSFMAECRGAIAEGHPEATVFFNGTSGSGRTSGAFEDAPRMWDANTHQELEDLPTTWGGYDKLPLRAKFFLKQGYGILGMSGKFHTSWGEFGGYKHPDAIRYEAASMLAFGAGCSFGDQLHPSGAVDMATYRNIGTAYEYVRSMEQYGIGGRPAATLGLWMTHSGPDDEGVSCMLLETQTDFDVVGDSEDLNRYEAIVLTGAPGLATKDAARLSSYLASGGKLLVLGESALEEGGERFLLPVGASYVGKAGTVEDYTVLRGGEKAVLRGLFVAGPFLNYAAAIRVRPDADAEVLADIREPYFDRTYEKYCSHLNTPYRPETAAHPAALRKGGIVFLPHRLGAIYHGNGARIHRELFSAALALVHARPLVRVSLPSAGRISLLHQEDRRRYVLHLLYAPPLQRGRCLVIEDMPRLANVEVQLSLPEKVRHLHLVPGNQTIAFEPAPNGYGLVTRIPEMCGHCALAAEY